MGRCFSTKYPTEMTLVPFDSAHRAGLNESKFTSVGCLVPKWDAISCPRESPLKTTSAWNKKKLKLSIKFLTDPRWVSNDSARRA